MRIVSWNCCGGVCEKRFRELAPLEPDIAILQECRSQVEGDRRSAIHFPGETWKGVAVVCRPPFNVRAGQLDAEVKHSVFPAEIDGPLHFQLLAIWAQNRPTYVRAIVHGIQRYSHFIRRAPTVIIGDFNSHTRWDHCHTVNHSYLLTLLQSEFDLHSAWHHFAERQGIADEPATHFWQHKEAQPFHLDYCFVPREWLSSIVDVRIGTFAQWQGQSDHMPIAVTLDL